MVKGGDFVLPVPTIEYLAQFTGEPVETFRPFADQALLQATLLFSTITQREDFPDDPDGEQLGVNAILEMAYRIYLEQPYAAAKANPFTSETIGSYSYAKGSTAAKAQQGLPTGLLWWDLAVEELSLVSRSLVSSGAVTVFENDAMYVDECADPPRKTVLSPANTVVPSPLWINAEKYPRDPVK